MKITRKKNSGQKSGEKFTAFASSRFLLRIMAFVAISGFMASCRQNTDVINLNGEWALHLGPEKPPHSTDPQSLDFNLSINLPGTLDDAGIGDPNIVEPKLEREVMLHLHRKVSYTGPAYYTREIDIPNNWKDKNIILHLERILWESVVWVNGQKVGNNLSLSTAHEYDLSSFLNPGKNTLTICVDNSKKFDLNRYDLAHAYTNHTQIIWNGILGDITLQANPINHVSNIVVYPDFKGKKVTGNFTVSQTDQMPENAQVKVLDKQKREVASVSVPVNGTNNSFELAIDEEIVPWNEFTPELYDLEVTLLGTSGKKLHSLSQTFGFRNLKARDGRFFINDKPIFLRGTLDCAIFPLTGYPHTDVESWHETFATVKDFGLNHIRFHSWCPPNAAFEAADQMGMYLQVELPNWGLNYGEDMGTVDFLNSEADEILKAYGNHPSFVLLSLGNELQGDFDLLNRFLSRLKEDDNRHLYTTTSFTFEKGHGLYPEPVDDYFITQYTEKGWVRGQGVFDQYPPRFNADYTEAVYHIQVPLVTHEIGQYSIFPDMSEIEKYTGVLVPTNFMAVKNDLEKKGLLPWLKLIPKRRGNSVPCSTRKKLKEP
jgi:beta-galactosidase/beta-glucuronidase